MKCSLDKSFWVIRKLLTVCHVDPLLLLPVALLVFKLKVYVGLPCNIRIVDHDIATLSEVCIATQHVGVVKYRLSDETARNRNFFRVELRNLIKSKFFVHVLIENDWVALFCCIFGFDLLTHQLFVAAGLDVASVILIEISELVVNVYGSKHLFFNNDFLVANFTLAVRSGANCVVLDLDHLDAIRHHVQGDPECQEDNPKHCEDCHGASVAGDRAPSWQHLLFKLGLFKLFDFLLDTNTLFLRNLHLTDK